MPHEKKEVRLTITNGPSHEEVRDSVGVRTRPRISVTFTIADIAQLCHLIPVGNQPHQTKDIKFTGVVDGMTWANGTGKDYILEIFMGSLSSGSEDIPFGRIFDAHYNTEARTGNMTLRDR